MASANITMRSLWAVSRKARARRFYQFLGLTSNLAVFRGWSETAAYIVGNGGKRADAEAGLRDAQINTKVFVEGLDLARRAITKVPEVAKQISIWENSGKRF